LRNGLCGSRAKSWWFDLRQIRARMTVLDNPSWILPTLSPIPHFLFARSLWGVGELFLRSCGCARRCRTEVRVQTRISDVILMQVKALLLLMLDTQAINDAGDMP
jgi:hypothetical protein